MFTLNSRDFRMWSSILKYFIKDNLIPEADAQVVSSSASLPAPVVAETEEQTLEREQNDRNVLSDALGEYECDAGMSGRFACDR